VGIIVDATVIMVESIFRHLRERSADRDPGLTHVETSIGAHLNPKARRILEGAADVSRPIFFSVTIVIAAFMPLFTMQGVEGQIFGPMAKTYGHALVGALLATFTVTPMRSSYLLPERTVERDTIVLRAHAADYRRILREVLAN